MCSNFEFCFCLDVLFFKGLDHGKPGGKGCMTKGDKLDWLLGLVTPRLSALPKLDDDLPQASNYNPKARKQKRRTGFATSAFSSK